ncbi:MAG TPA: Sec-independent protein translocase subunit TatA [Mycobacteriales bacterium]|nr:Sec-independent protein translocase subunit TatA [Mycobacteriales bacterium]
MGFPSGWELVLVLLVILVLFGAKRLPDSARALGRSMRILKAETKGLRDDSDADLSGGAARRDTTVTAEPLPPAQPGTAPRPAHGSQQEGAPSGDTEPRP